MHQVKELKENHAVYFEFNTYVINTKFNIIYPYYLLTIMPEDCISI